MSKAVFKPPFREPAAAAGSQKRRRFLKSQNDCCRCGRPIDTYLEHVPMTRFAIERAQCLHCMTLVRVKNHSIQ